MGRYLYDASARLEATLGASANECREAMLSELEFIETARMLKMLAREMGQDEGMVVERLARHGLEAALDVLAGAQAIGLSEACLCHYARWRDGRSARRKAH
ncbi:hypothetical protein EDF56_106142 [Novosphingobium sp. PhB165]|uniref:hypothetical protein n=1 Tax=Novosphingobium sp. PhB165 TaxID=2485105 RepID=UPI0010F34D0E|nr:hypothetical protein [Novosphingobium sp. PhB165]TCM17030.1 hypothetical protein EDF56_106142 [Novosphingobium sp. PhB165]